MVLVIIDNDLLIRQTITFYNWLLKLLSMENRLAKYIFLLSNNLLLANLLLNIGSN